MRKSISPPSTAEIGTISKVRIVNREDCCSERAAPLIVELSNDAKGWTQVAYRHDEFDTWTAKFKSIQVRYVRLRSPRTTMLHLRTVQLLP